MSLLEIIISQYGDHSSASDSLLSHRSLHLPAHLRKPQRPRGSGLNEQVYVQEIPGHL
jgi:hypothetical protein